MKKVNIIYNNEIIDTIGEALILADEYKSAFHTNDVEIEINF